jgi:hypothetical protein
MRQSFFFPLRLLRQFTINSAINTTELKTVPTINTTNTSIKLETEKAKNRSIAASLYVLHLSKKFDAAVLSNNANSSFDFELLETRSPSKLGDTHFRMSSTAYSVYYNLHSISGDHLLRHNLRIGHNVMTSGT